MAREIHARFSKGMIEPLEELDLQEGEEIRIIITKNAKWKRMIDALQASAGGWKGTHDPEELKLNIYADRLINTRPQPYL